MRARSLRPLRRHRGLLAYATVGSGHPAHERTFFLRLYTPLPRPSGRFSTEFAQKFACHALYSILCPVYPGVSTGGSASLKLVLDLQFPNGEGGAVLDWLRRSEEAGPGRGTRTCARVPGGPGGIRTHDSRIKSPELYH